NEIALRDSAGQAHRAHRGFRSAGNKSNLLDRRNRLCDQRGELNLKLRRRPITRAALRLFRDRLRYRGMRVPQQHRSPRTNIIEQLISVGIVEILPSAPLNDERLAPDGTKRPHRAIHASDEYFFRSLEYLPRTPPLDSGFFGCRAHAFSPKAITPSTIELHLWRDTSE